MCERISGPTTPAGGGGPFRRTRLPRGACLYQRGELIERVHRVERGRVRLSATTPGGAPHAFSSRGPGALLGLEGLTGRVAMRDAVVAEPAELSTAPVDEAIAWFAAHPEEHVRYVLDELARTQAERALAVGDAVARAARYCLALAEDPLLSGWRGAAHWEVACLLGIRPETLSRALRELEARGAIVDRRDLRVVDREVLEALADHSG